MLANFIVFPYFLAVNVTDSIMYKPFLILPLIKPEGRGAPCLGSLRVHACPSILKPLGQSSVEPSGHGPCPASQGRGREGQGPLLGAVFIAGAPRAGLGSLSSVRLPLPREAGRGFWLGAA